MKVCDLVVVIVVVVVGRGSKAKRRSERG